MGNGWIGLHAALGELGSFCFLWIFVELLDPTLVRLMRAKVAALSGFLLLMASWVVGGFYYLTQYAASVKPVIKASATPWAHSIVMEAKEHIFIFLPFLALFVYISLRKSGQALLTDQRSRVGLLVLSGTLFLTGMSMAGLGYIISGAFRSAIEMRSTL